MPLRFSVRFAADLVLLDENPLDSRDALRGVRLVLRSGRVVWERTQNGIGLTKQVVEGGRFIEYRDVGKGVSVLI